LPFQLLSDADRSIAEAYGAAKPGSKGGANRIGVTIDTEGLVLKHYGDVNPFSFPAEALEDVGG